jgi:hypothetical protein
VTGEIEQVSNPRVKRIVAYLSGYCKPRIRFRTYEPCGRSNINRKDWDSKYGSDAYKGPYEIVDVRSNGTVRVNEGRVTDTYNIRMMITPYHRRS